MDYVDCILDDIAKRDVLSDAGQVMARYIDGLEDKRNALLAHIAKLDRERQNLIQERDEKQIQIEATLSQVDAMEEKLRQRDEKNELLLQDLNRYENQSHALRSSINDLKSSIAAVDDQIIEDSRLYTRHFGVEIRNGVGDELSVILHHVSSTDQHAHVVITCKKDRSSTGIYADRVDPPDLPGVDKLKTMVNSRSIDWVEFIAACRHIYMAQ